VHHRDVEGYGVRSPTGGHEDVSGAKVGVGQRYLERVTQACVSQGTG